MTSLRRQLGLWLRQGIAPRRLALTLALGCAIGCIPIFGVTTLLCLCLAFVFRLNLPVIQAANYAVMPAQLVLIVPFMRFGGWLLHGGAHAPLPALALLHASPLAIAGSLGVFAAQALFAWLIVAAPAVLLLTFALTALLRRIPVLAAAEAAAPCSSAPLIAEAAD